MRNIKNNINMSEFDDFLCKLEEKEEFGCFVVYCLSVVGEHCKSVLCGNNCTTVTSDHDTVDGQNDEHKLDTNDGQNDEHKLDTNDGQNDEHKLDTNNDQNDEHKLDTNDGQNDEHKLDTNNDQNDEHKLDTNDGQNDKQSSAEIDHKSAKQHKSICWINRPPA